MPTDHHDHPAVTPVIDAVDTYQQARAALADAEAGIFEALTDIGGLYQAGNIAPNIAYAALGRVYWNTPTPDDGGIRVADLGRPFGLPQSEVSKVAGNHPGTTCTRCDQTAHPTSRSADELCRACSDTIEAEKRAAADRRREEGQARHAAQMRRRAELDQMTLDEYRETREAHAVVRRALRDETLDDYGRLVHVPAGCFLCRAPAAAVLIRPDQPYSSWHPDAEPSCARCADEVCVDGRFVRLT